MREPIVFFGTEKFSGPSLKALIENDWPVNLVVTKPDSPSGRGRKLTQPEIKTIAESHGIKVIQPPKLKPAAHEIKKAGCDLAVLVAYGNIVPQVVIDVFSKGIINVHPSKLPAYRGAAPIEHAILNGDVETAVSLMKLVMEMDAGPVYFSQPVELKGSETQFSLYNDLSKLGAELLINHLPSIAAGSLTAKPQLGKPSYAPKLSKLEGQLDFSLPAELLERKVRAFNVWPQSHIVLGGRDVAVLKAKVIEARGRAGDTFIFEGLPSVYCGIDALAIEELKPAGKPAMSGKAYLAGNKI